MRCFIHYWRTDTVAFHKSSARASKGGFEHTASGLLKARGVGPGNTLYGISYTNGQLHVLGRMIVKDILPMKQAVAALGTNDLWDAPDHAIARRGSFTKPLQYDSTVSPTNLKKIRFICADGAERPPARNKQGDIDFQTFRNVREITEETAKLLDKTLGA